MNEPFCFSMFFGLVLILLGLSIFLNILFGINIPVARVFIGILLCYFGYYILVGHPFSWSYSSRYAYSDHKYYNHTTVMGSSTIVLDENSLKQQDPFEYSTTMGETIIDITRIYPSQEEPKVTHTLNINTTMGKTILKINKASTINIHADSSLGNVILPDGSKISSGSHRLSSQPDSSPTDIELYAHTILGELEIKLV